MYSVFLSDGCLREHADFTLTGIHLQKVPTGVDPQGCQEKCYNKPECKLFTWKHPGSFGCKLMRGIDKTKSGNQPKETMVSGEIESDCQGKTMHNIHVLGRGLKLL